MRGVRGDLPLGSPQRFALGFKARAMVASEAEAMLFATTEVKKAGAVGSIRVVDQTIYYDIHPEMA